MAQLGGFSNPAELIKYSIYPEFIGNTYSDAQEA
jgi:hypothetical protein